LKESYGELVGNEDVRRRGRRQRDEGEKVYEKERYYQIRHELNDDDTDDSSSSRSSSRRSSKDSDREDRERSRSRSSSKSSRDSDGEEEKKGKKKETKKQKKARKERERRQMEEDEEFEAGTFIGYKDRFFGTMKEGVGRLIGDDDLVHDGERQRRRGEYEVRAAYDDEDDE